MILAAIPGIAQETHGPAPLAMGPIRIGSPQMMPSQPTAPLEARRFRLRIDEPELPPMEEAPTFIPMAPVVPFEPAAPIEPGPTVRVPVNFGSQPLPSVDAEPITVPALSVHGPVVQAVAVTAPAIPVQRRIIQATAIVAPTMPNASLPPLPDFPEFAPPAPMAQQPRMAVHESPRIDHPAPPRVPGFVHNAPLVPQPFVPQPSVPLSTVVLDERVVAVDPTSPDMPVVVPQGPGPQMSVVVQQVPAAAQPTPAQKLPAASDKGPGEETVIRINPRPPTPKELFRLESEQQFNARLHQESDRWKDNIEGLEKRPPARNLIASRGWPALTEGIEPNRLCFSRLLFRPRASERYGQGLGALQPFVSTGAFYYDLARSPVTAMFAVVRPVQCDDHRDLFGFNAGGW